MKECPNCGKWTLSFDDYFGRFRCFDCGWMPMSSTEQAIRLIEAHQEPKEIWRDEIEEIGLIVTVAFDEKNDALIFSFGENEPSFDLPEPDGMLMWKISYETRRVIGFVILGAQELGVSKVSVDVAARKAEIEQKLKWMPSVLASGRATKFLIDAVSISTKSEEVALPEPDRRMREIYNSGIREFNKNYAQT